MILFYKYFKCKPYFCEKKNIFCYLLERQFFSLALQKLNRELINDFIHVTLLGKQNKSTSKFLFLCSKRVKTDVLNLIAFRQLTSNVYDPIYYDVF